MLADTPSISAGYMNMLHISTFFDPSVLTNTNITSGELLTIGVMSAIIMLIVAVVLLVTAVMFVARFIILIFLMILLNQYFQLLGRVSG